MTSNEPQYQTLSDFLDVAQDRLGEGVTRRVVQYAVDVGAVTDLGSKHGWRTYGPQALEQLTAYMLTRSKSRYMDQTRPDQRVRN